MRMSGGSAGYFDACREETEMDRFGKIAVLSDIIEAQLLDSVLNERGIPHVMRTYHDSAYDGLFQAAMGWGHVEAPEEHRAEIISVLDSIRSNA